MRKQIIILMALLLSVAGATSAGAEAVRKVTGGIQWRFPGSYGWFEVDVHEVASEAAHGSVNLREYQEGLGWRHWRGHPICVDFEILNGVPVASFVVQIDLISGWGPGEVGQYMKLWVSDSGKPAAEGDLAGFVVFPPRDKQPDCGYKNPRAYWPLVGGDLVIHD